MMAFRYIVPFFLITLIGCRKNYDDMLTTSLVQKDYVPVKVEKLEVSAESIPVFAIGRLASDIETKLSFKTGGYIAALNFKEGDYVRKGKLLGQLQTAEIDAQVRKAEQALEKSRRDLVRIQAMYADSVATLENVQDLTTLVAVQEADLEIARYNQQYSRIISPISGRVLNKLAEQNELVSPGQPILVVGSSGNQSYLMTINISDKDISLINYGARGEIRFDAYQDRVFDASVSRISESADPVTGTFEVELNIDGANARLRNGMIGKVTLYPVTQERFVKIPMVSIAEGDGLRADVYLPSSDKETAIKKTINIARFADDYVWVSEGEIESDQIITVGSAYLKDGQKIKINK